MKSTYLTSLTLIIGFLCCFGNVSAEEQKNLPIIPVLKDEGRVLYLTYDMLPSGASLGSNDDESFTVVQVESELDKLTTVHLIHHGEAGAQAELHYNLNGESIPFGTVQAVEIETDSMYIVNGNTRETTRTFGIKPWVPHIRAKFSATSKGLLFSDSGKSSLNLKKFPKYP